MLPDAVQFFIAMKRWKLLLASGIISVAIPAQSPSCNPHAERFIKSIRHECLDHFIVFGETRKASCKS